MVMEYNQHTNDIILYTYNANGNITQKKWFSKSSVTIDDDDEFDYHMNSTYSYNKIDFVYSTTNPNQLVSYQQFSGEHTSTGDVEQATSNNFSISYDANGNALSTFAKGVSASDFYTLTWNGNLLASAENSSKHYKYKYDSDNQLIEKDYYRKNNNGSLTLNTVEKYVWNNGRIEGFEMYYVDLEPMRFSVKYLYDENNQLLGMIPHVKMIWTGADLPEYQSNFQSLPFATDKVMWFVNDGQGNIVSVYSEDREVQMGCFYDANGKIDIDLSGPYIDDLGTGWQELGSALQVAAFFTSFTKSTYKGYYQDEDTGLIFTKNRVYNPYISRFINSDPENILSNIDNCLNTNEYVFSNNNPVNLDAFNQSVFDKNSIPYAAIKSPLWFRNYFNN